jgi:hypothetical protein
MVELVVQKDPGLGNRSGACEHAAQWILARLPPETTVGHKPTNWMVPWVLMVGAAEPTSVRMISSREGVGHLLTVTRIACNHHVRKLEEGVRHVSDGEMLVIGIFDSRGGEKDH